MDDKAIKEFQKIYKEQYGRDISWEEAEESANNLLGLFETLHEIGYSEQKRKEKLKDHPKGYHLDDGKTYSCCICRQSVCNETSWYDQSGTKCLHCQRAIERKTIPRKVCKNDKIWYSAWEFEEYFDIKSVTLNKYVRQGKLKPRIIKNIDTKNEHCKIFLISDNADVLPQKPESYLVEHGEGLISTDHDKIDLKEQLQKMKI